MSQHCMEEDSILLASNNESVWRPSGPSTGHNQHPFDNCERKHLVPTPLKMKLGWRGDQPAEELSVRGLPLMEKFEQHTPVDRFKVVYIIFFIHGVGILMPWNMFITAKAYFEDYKLLPTSTTTAISPELDDYRTNFLSYIGMASQFPYIIMNFVNVFCGCGGKSGTRIVCSIVIMVLVLTITILLAMIDSSAWPELFFWITIGSVILINSACGIYQNSIYGMVAILPMKYTNAIIFGNNFCGAFVSCVSIFSIMFAPDVQTSAIYYFLIALVILLIAFDSNFLLPHLKYFRHWRQLAKPDGIRQLKSTEEKITDSSGHVGVYITVFKQIWPLTLSVFFVFFVSLALFPQVQSDIKKVDMTFFPDAYWTPVFCFLNFSLFAMLGNICSEWIRFPSPRFVWIPVLMRVFFIPAYLLCNFRPEDRVWPVLIEDSYAFISISALMAFTSGYYSSVCMMYAPKRVSLENASTAGMMMALFLIAGVLCGVNCSRFLVSLIT